MPTEEVKGASSLDTTPVRKRCSDCKHYHHVLTNYGTVVHPAVCLHPENGSVVDGHPLQTPEYLRYHTIQCGMSANWWEPKDEPAP